MGLFGQDARRCERCRYLKRSTRLDPASRRWLCRDCFADLPPPPGTPPHPEDRPGWQVVVRRRTP